MATLYVSTSGSDSNNGSETAPFRTISKAASVVVPGSTVYVASGTYSEMISSTRSGTASSRIRYVSNGAKIVPTNDTSGWLILWYNQAAYVDIVGFELDGTSNQYFSHGIYNEGGNVDIYNNYVHHLRALVFDGDAGNNGAGIDTASADYNSPGPVRIFRNIVHDIGNVARGTKASPGMYIAVPDVEVYNNIVYRVEGVGIQLNHNPQYVLVANNLVFESSMCAFYVGGEGYIAKGNRFFNNIAMSSAQNLCDNGDTCGTHWINNISWDQGSGFDGWYYPIYGEIGTIHADPRFIMYRADGTGDYHLADGSPAIDAGVSDGAPTTDYDGAVRPIGSAVDIGPYEYGSGITGGLY